MQTFFLAPIGFNAGLTSVALGAIHSLEQAGLRVGFVKPIAQGADPRSQSAPLISRAPSAGSTRRNRFRWSGSSTCCPRVRWIN